MNRIKIIKINHLLTQTRICSRGGAVLSLVSKDLISNLNKIKDYEVTSRNTSLS